MPPLSPPWLRLPRRLCNWHMVSRLLSAESSRFFIARNKKADGLHPLRGGAVGLTALPRGLRHLRMALGTIGDFARCAGGSFAPCAARVFRWLRPATKGSASGLRDFGLPAVRWQEWSARNFASGQGAALQPYWMYGKKPHRRHGGKGPASTADTRAVGSPHKKKSSKTFNLAPRRGTGQPSAPAGRP